MVVITPAEMHHVDAVAVLVEEMDRHYGSTEFEPLEQRITQVTDALFGDVPAAFVLLAWEDDELVGLASYSFLWPAAGVTRSLYLKELYVAQARRRLGIGRQLMDTLFDVARKHRCRRVELTTDRENEEARRFYAGLGVPVNIEKMFHRVELTASG